MDRLIAWRDRQALVTRLKWTYLVASGGVMVVSTLFLIGFHLYFVDRVNGCDRTQGYLYTRPCPAAQISLLLARRGQARDAELVQ